jgi:uncharacterized protein with FMN-binding domain
VRRIIGWASTTVTLLVLLFGYHTSTSSTPATTSQTAISSGPVAGSGSGSGSSAVTTGGSSGASSGGSSGEVTGDVVQTRYGPVQVALTVSGGKVTGAAAVQYPDGDPSSSQISSFAMPVLTDETVAAQSSSIDMVSGATYTSTGYVQSLQSALDRAGL